MVIINSTSVSCGLASLLMEYVFLCTQECEVFVTVYSSIACTPAVKAYALCCSNGDSRPAALPVGVLLEPCDVGTFQTAPIS